MADDFPYKLGLRPPKPGALPLMLRNYLKPNLLPDADSLPKKFGHDGIITDWGMDLNDRIGDCFVASVQHSTSLLLAEAGITVTFNDSISTQNSAVVNYSAITGYEPGPELEDPDNAPPNPTDRGTDIGDGMRYWQNTGVVDGDNQHHQIVGFAGLTVGDWDELLIAIRLFQTVQIGIAVPDFAETQFANGQPWHLQRGLYSEIGGHCIPGMARDSVGKTDAIHVVTWGKDIVMEQQFYERFNIIAAVGFSEEMLVKMQSIDGVDDQALRADLQALDTGQVA